MPLAYDSSTDEQQAYDQGYEDNSNGYSIACSPYSEDEEQELYIAYLKGWRESDLMWV